MAADAVASSLLHSATGRQCDDCRDSKELDGAAMLDREKIVAVLKRRFSNAGADQIAAAANAIIGLDDEWEEVPLGDRVPCSDQCYLAKSVEDGARIIVLKKPPDAVA
jgi:hypothetical protein